MKTLFNREEAIDIINSGKILSIAGDIELLRSLPKGNWIGGSIPYFMSEKGGLCSKEVCQITEFPKETSIQSIKFYQAKELEKIPADYPANGLSFILIPANSEVHLVYAQNCSSWKGFYDHPILGWVTGVDLKDLDKQKPLVLNGQTGQESEDFALVMHLSLPDNLYSQIHILNLFSQGKGDVITFPKSGVRIDECLINGKKESFSKYLKENKIATELPLVASYYGALINVSFKTMNDSFVEMYAPVFKGVEYRLALPIKDYEERFNQEVAKHDVKPIFSCNCILNYLYAHLEGKNTGNIKGPMTFGEIAYILLNQTMVYLTFNEKSKES